MERKTIIKIILKNQFQLKIVLLHSNKQEEVVRLKDNKEEYNPCVTMQNNYIELFKETENTLYFIQDLIDKPEEYKLYSFVFQDKTMKLLLKCFLL